MKRDPSRQVSSCAVEHERRDADRRQQVADVDLGVHEPERLARARARAASHVRRVPAQRAPGRAGCPGRRGRASLSSPPTPSRLPRGGRGAGGDPLRSPRAGSPAPASHAGRCPSGSSDSVRSGWVAAKSVDIAPPSERPSSDRPLRADGVQHCTNVVHARLQVGQALGGDPVGEAGAALVEEDQSPHRREPPVERRELRVFPAGLERADPAVDEHEVDRPVADDLVGDPDVAASRVGDLARGPC